MNKDELILEIIEKVHDNVQRLEKQVRDIQIEQIRQGEMHIRNTLNVEEHVRRSNALEESVDILRAEIIPIKKHVNIVEFSIKVLMWLIGSSGLILFIKNIIN